MRMNLRAGAALLGAIVTAGAAQAAVVFDFSFMSTPDYGTVAGAVSGTLVFQTTGSGVAASQAYVTSAPAGVIESGSIGKNLLAMAPYVFSNAFTISDAGVVSAASFGLSNGTYAVDLEINNGSNGGATFLYDFVTQQYTQSAGGFAGTTYTPRAAAASDVPEPAIWTTMVVGLGLVGAALRSRCGVSIRTA